MGESERESGQAGEEKQGKRPESKKEKRYMEERRREGGTEIMEERGRGEAKGCRGREGKIARAK